MSGSEQDVAHSRLLALLAERAREGSAADPAHARDREIDTLAAQLGLAPEEVDDMTPAVVQTVGRQAELVGRFRIYRRPSTFLPFVFGLMLMGIVASMGEQVIAAAGAAVLAAAWVVRGRFAVIRFEIDTHGRLDTRRHGTIDWHQVDEVTFDYRRPWLAPRGRIESLAGTVAKVRIRRRDGSTVRLAQGQLFLIRPGRRPVHLADLARFLRRQAREAGMRVEKRGDDGWRADRPGNR